MRYIGVFAELFGIRPWEYDRLTVIETRLLEQYVNKRIQSMKSKDE